MARKVSKNEVIEVKEEHKKKNYELTLEARNMEIRKIESVDASFEKDGKIIDSHYIRLSCDDENEDRVYFRDKNMENLKKYKKGMVVKFFIKVGIEDFFKTAVTSWTVVGFEEEKEEE